LTLAVSEPQRPGDAVDNLMVDRGAAGTGKGGDVRRWALASPRLADLPSS
jgi:hypothetical protein